MSTTTLHTMPTLTANREFYPCPLTVCNLTESGTYIATRTPDEVYKEIVRSLSLDDAVQTSTLRDILLAAIVPAQLPSGAVPAIATGPAVRFRDQPPATSKSSYAGNDGSSFPGGAETVQSGPPVDFNKSFYIHHTDERFPQLYPHADRSTYLKPKLKNPLDQKKDKYRISKHAILPNMSGPSTLSQVQPNFVVAAVKKELEAHVEGKVTHNTILKSQDKTVAVPNPEVVVGDGPAIKNDGQTITVQEQRAVMQTTVEGDSGIDMPDVPMSDGVPSAEVKDEDDVPVADRISTLSVSRDLSESRELRQDSIFSSQADSTYGTQPTDSQDQTSTDFKKPRVPRRRKIYSATPRRSSRLANSPSAQPASTPMTTSTADPERTETLSPLPTDKRSRGSDTEFTEPERKKSKH